MRRLLIAVAVLALSLCAWAGDFPGSPISSTGTATVGDNTLTPLKLKASGTPDNTMVPFWDSSGLFRWAPPAGGGTVTSVSGTTGIAVANPTTTPALSLTDNGVSGAKLTDNTVTDAKIVGMAYAKLTGVPSTFAPSAHASAHVTGGGDVIASAVASGNAGLLTGADKAKLDGIASGATVGADWNTNVSNKPTLGTAAAKNIPATGDASATEVVYGTDTRLTNARTPSSHNNTAHSETYLTTTGSAAGLTSFPTLNQNTSGTAAGLSATLAIGSGGTGATTAGAALTALGGDNASNLSTGTIPAARVPTLNQSTTGTAGGLVFGSDARGDLPIRGASAYGRLAIGTTGKILTTDGTDPSWSAYTVAAPGATGAVLTSDGTNWTRNAAPAISAANMTSFPTLNQNTTGTASNVSGTPALPNGTTATTQSAHDNGTKLATTRYVDGRDQFYRFNIDAPATTDNVMFDGPLFVGVTLDNVVFVVQDNTGKLSGSSSDNVTVNIIYCGAADNTAAQCTKVFTSDQTPTGAAVLSPALNNTTPGTGNYLRFYVAASNMTNKKLYIRVRYRE